MKCVKWSVIISDGTLSPVNEKWSLENGTKLERLKKKEITMCNTAVGRLEARKEKGLTAVLGKSRRVEMDGWKAMINFMDDAEAGDNGEEGAA